MSYECERCKDVGFIFTKNERGFDVAEPCSCQEIKRLKTRMMNSGIHEKDLKKGFNDFETFEEQSLKNVKNMGISYFSNFEDIKNSDENSLLLSGPSGRGKTTLALAVANNLMKNKNEAVLYLNYREQITYLKQVVNDQEKYGLAMERYKKANILFIDDLFKGKLTESDINIAYEIINFRCLKRLPMIITTQRSLDELMDFDDAIGGRIIERSMIAVFDEAIPNFRLRKGAC